MKYHGAATHDDASKFRARMKERERIAEKRRELAKATPKPGAPIALASCRNVQVNGVKFK